MSKIRYHFFDQVVNGSPLNVLAIHQPVSSFDTDGRYIGLSRLAQMLQSTPDTPEPDSPYDMYESSLHLSSEQQSPVAQVPAEDPRVILNKVKIQYVHIKGLLHYANRAATCLATLLRH